MVRKGLQTEEEGEWDINHQQQFRPLLLFQVCCCPPSSLTVVIIQIRIRVYWSLKHVCCVAL